MAKEMNKFLIIFTMNKEIMISKDNLPATIEELVNVVSIGKE